jgi:O-acetyl-ADP-ribose deacetylase (regulator of RNase III)
MELDNKGEKNDLPKNDVTPCSPAADISPPIERREDEDEIGEASDEGSTGNVETQNQDKDIKEPEGMDEGNQIKENPVENSSSVSDSTLEPEVPSTPSPSQEDTSEEISEGEGTITPSVDSQQSEKTIVPTMQKSLTTSSTTSSRQSEDQSQAPSVPSLKKMQTEKPQRTTKPQDRFFQEMLRIQKRAQEYINKSFEEKRPSYRCGRRYKTLDDVPSWADDDRRKASAMRKTKSVSKKRKPMDYSRDPDLCKKISLWRGDITTLEVDAIVNAANSSLLGGGGVDGAIHSAAGGLLRQECGTLGGCSTGDAKITAGYKLPAKYVIHTVGPITLSPDRLESCYRRSLEYVLEKNIKSVAFPCIATGIYGYPNEEAAHVALTVVREWLEEHRDKVERIIFCVFLETDLKIYTDLLCRYFPMDGELCPCVLFQFKLKHSALPKIDRSMHVALVHCYCYLVWCFCVRPQSGFHFGLKFRFHSESRLP